MIFRDIFSRRSAPLMAVSLGPVLLALFVLLGPFITSPLYVQSGLGTGLGGAVLPGFTTIDPNIGITSFALGYRAALDVIAGHLPLWNHYQGLGAPLLGEMQSAALFPPTLMLLLPHGQALEHIFLQWLAGLGTYLFLRRFGLGATAAVVGAVLYEFNGVFATLRNAAFNPVAFLPWLLFGVEALRAEIVGERPFPARLSYIGLTAFAAALALYAGFPETTYLYSFLVVGWALFRLAGLGYRQAWILFLSLAAAALLALLLSAPLLTAFVAFLGEGDVGAHGGAFVGTWQEKQTSILYLLPYLYGTFMAAPDPRLAGLSISSGGYIALAPVVLAAAALCTPGHRAVKILLSAWIVVAIGVSHGWPVIHAASMALPLMELAVAGRYLNTSWIFCTVVLASLMIDQLPRLTTQDRRRGLLGAVVGTILVVTACTFPSLDMIPAAWTHVPTAVIASLAAGVFAAACACIALNASSPRMRGTALAAMLCETAALFVVPFLSYPRRGSFDADAASFLQKNAGYQRVAKTDGAGLTANFGAALGVPLIHFDDLPSPRRTIDYVKANIDPYADNIFLPEHPALPDAELAARRGTFRGQLPAYAAAGVKYVMAAPDFYAEVRAPVIYRDERPVILNNGETLFIESRHTAPAMTIAAVTLRVSTFNNSATGPLTLRLCSTVVCVDGRAEMGHVEDGRLIYIPLDAPLTLDADTPYTAAFRKQGPTAAVIWTYPLADGSPPVQVHESPMPVAAGRGVELAFIAEGSPLPVHASRSMAIFELAGVRPYAAAPECDVAMISHDEIRTSCARASHLTRLNVHMRGWTAAVNGVDAPISLAEDTFQVIDIPEGAAHISFRYAPPGFGLALAGAAAAFLGLIAAFALAGVHHYRSRR